MTVFISYNNADSQFVDLLATNLVRLKHHVWMDRWELSIGDSLLDKIQSALSSSSAVIVVLSKTSVASEWCRKELNASLVREIEEKKSLLIPCVVDDCEIPLFVREKLYADFRSDPTKAFQDVVKALAPVLNPYQGHVENPAFHTDWAVDWKTIDGQLVLDWAFVDHGHEWPYVISSRCTVVCNEVATKCVISDGGEVDDAQLTFVMKEVLGAVLALAKPGDLTFTFDDNFEKVLVVNATGSEGRSYDVMLACRRLGQDNGMDTLFYFDNVLKQAVEHTGEVSKFY